LGIAFQIGAGKNLCRFHLGVKTVRTEVAVDPLQRIVDENQDPGLVSTFFSRRRAGNCRSNGCGHLRRSLFGFAGAGKNDRLL
jgi:hypothetical protein